ncbi:hypothetical protein NDI43_19275 [Microcoleus vaginatus GB2-A3]
MLMSTIASDYFPKTAQGQVLCFFLALCAIGVCGYLTAALTTFFVSQDAESDRAEIAATEQFKLWKQKLLHCQGSSLLDEKV